LILSLTISHHFVLTFMFYCFTASDGADEDQCLAQVWTEVENFVQGNTQLQQLLEKLRGQSEHLQASELELRGMADEIRRQAIDALK
jgi:alkyl hydroperoxide reductase subunit AhpF